MNIQYSKITDYTAKRCKDFTNRYNCCLCIDLMMALLRSIIYLQCIICKTSTTRRQAGL